MSLLVKNKKGFTLIEIVIVLAIAALVLAGVLLAVGGAQRSQRDSARKGVAARTATAMENHASNNNGSYPPTATTALAASYLVGIIDTDTDAAPTNTGAPASATATSGVRYVAPATCANGAAVASTGRRYAVVYWSENAGATQCLGN
ncbi:MAG TPA: type II secretion system protein [Candidatus Dormibacteraeota bacterium]|nr:type II secretion system protein [Candidatus Dormibacteraeota bacterium]